MKLLPIGNVSVDPEAVLTPRAFRDSATVDPEAAICLPHFTGGPTVVVRPLQNLEHDTRVPLIETWRFAL